jgi:hypothetical protein
MGSVRSRDGAWSWISEGCLRQWLDQDGRRRSALVYMSPRNTRRSPPRRACRPTQTTPRKRVNPISAAAENGAGPSGATNHDESAPLGPTGEDLTMPTTKPGPEAQAGHTPHRGFPPRGAADDRLWTADSWPSAAKLRAGLERSNPP